MQHRPTLVALALTGALGLAPMGLLAQNDSSGQSGGSSSSNQGSSSSSNSNQGSGSSDQSADSSQSADQEQSGSPFLRTVDEAYKAMRQVRAARLSIFEGETDTAKELVQAAMKDMEAAQSRLDQFSMPSGQSNGQSNAQAGDRSGNQSGSQQASGGGGSSNDSSGGSSDTQQASSGSGGSGGGQSGSGQSGDGQRYLPIDLSIGVAEGYLIPEDRTSALAQANAAFLQGDRRTATRILRDASIDVIVQASTIPAQKSLDNLKQADELMGQEKFYEANVALKAIEDSVTNRSFALDAMPRQGQGSQGGSQSKSSG